VETQGEFFADKLMDLANLAAAALIFGQLVSGQRLEWGPLLMGSRFTCGLWRDKLRLEIEEETMMSGQEGAALFMLVLLILIIVGASVLMYVERPKKPRHRQGHTPV